MFIMQQNPCSESKRDRQKSRHSEEASGGTEMTGFEYFLANSKLSLFLPPPPFSGKLHDTNIYECQMVKFYSICLAHVPLNEFCYAQETEALMNRSL